MRSMLLLIDLQNDFLGAARLQPSPASVVRQAARLLGACRRLAIPVAHAWTTVRPGGERMPHWKRAGLWQCVEGTSGHLPPPVLRPLETETIVHKVFFSAFSSGDLDPLLARLGADTLILAGVHLHACIRATALDALQRGLNVIVADDAAGSHDPLHAAITRRYLLGKTIEFESVERLTRKLQIELEEPPAEQPATVHDRASQLNCSPLAATAVHRSPRAPQETEWRIPYGREEEVAAAAAMAAEAWRAWATTPVPQRAAVLQRLADRLQADAERLVELIVHSVGKPIVYARMEVLRSAEMLRTIANRAETLPEQAHGVHECRGGRAASTAGHGRPDYPLE